MRIVGATLSAVNVRLGARVLVWGALLAALAAVLSFVPLFDVLGYDFAFAIGLATALAAADIGHGAVAASRRQARGAQARGASHFADEPTSQARGASHFADEPTSHPASAKRAAKGASHFAGAEAPAKPAESGGAEPKGASHFADEPTSQARGASHFADEPTSHPARAKGASHFAPGAGWSTARLFGRALAGALGVLVLPLAISLVNALRVRNCSLASGLAFYALLPVGTALFAAPAGVIAALVAPRGGRLLAFALVPASLGWSAWRLYRDPAVFAFDPFGGYFPGPIYDEALRPPARLLYYRLVNLVWIGSAVAVTLAARGRGRDARRWRPIPALLAAGLVPCSAALFLSEGRLGFHIDRSELGRRLDRETRSEHFRLRTMSSERRTEAELGLTIEDLEFRYAQLTRILGVEPRGPVTVYAFPDAETKKALVGAGNTLFARPWTREIFVQGERFPAPHLRHELAHVFAGAFGDPLFGVALAWQWFGPIPVPRLASGLVEGVAEAADFGDPSGRSTTHQEAAAIIAEGRGAPLANVVGTGFSTLSGPRAYTLAGSFCRFLMETRGPERLRALYRSAGDFEGTYGTSLAALEAEWKGMLARQVLNQRDRASAREHFRRPAIFKKVCARELAARVSEARSLVGVDPGRAVHLLEATCADDPNEPTFQIDLAQALAASGATERALDVLTALSRRPDLTPPLRARALGVQAGLHIQRGDVEAARRAEREALDEAAEDVDRRQVQAKLRALADPDARRTLGRALYGDTPGVAQDPVLTFFLMSEFMRLHPGDPLGPYLVGRQLLSRDPSQALPLLARACDEEAGTDSLPAPVPPTTRPEVAGPPRREVAGPPRREVAGPPHAAGSTQTVAGSPREMAGTQAVSGRQTLAGSGSPTTERLEVAGTRVPSREPRPEVAGTEGLSGLSRELVLECRRMTVEAAYRAGEMPRARRAVARMLAAAETDAERLRAEDLRERIDWKEHRPAQPTHAPSLRQQER